MAAWESQLEAHGLAVRSVLAWRIISLTGDSRDSPWNLFLFRGIYHPSTLRPEVLAQQLKHLLLFVEDPGLSPSNHMMTHN